MWKLNGKTTILLFFPVESL